MSLAIIAFFLLLLLLLFRIFPRRRDLRQVSRPLYQLHLEHAPVHLRLTAVVLIAAAGTGFLTYLFVPALSDYRLSLIPGQRYTFRPAHDMAAVAGVITGLFLGGLTALLWGRRLLRDKWPEYIVYQSLRYKGVSPALLKYSIAGLGLMACGATIAATDQFLVFTGHSIEVKKVFSPVARSYTYNQVDEVRRVESFTTFAGNVIFDPHTVILFADGNEWNFRSEGLSPVPDEKAFVPWLLQQTGKKLVQLEHE